MLSPCNALCRFLPLLALAACSGPVIVVKPEEPPPFELALVAQLDGALARGATYLIERQEADGAWRSTTYGAFKDGFSLTPVILKALAFAHATETTGPAVVRGQGYLVTLLDAEGRLPYLGYAVYTLSTASIVLSLSGDPAHRAVRDRLVQELRDRQLTEANGWSPTDVSYGGWGYWDGKVTKPPAGAEVPELLSSNLPSTMVAIGALRLIGVPAEDPALRKALGFVRSCQNFVADPATGDPAYDDGGFFFTPANEVQNKAMGGVDRHGRKRYRSYGSMTAEGIRALLRLDVPRDDPALQAASRWLQKRFSPSRPPGDYPQIREVQRDSVFYYWSWSAAHALQGLGIRVLDPELRGLPWPEQLARELLAKQRPDGSWVNPSADMREDNPLVATPLAMAGLGIARRVMAGDSGVPAAGVAGER